MCMDFTTLEALLDLPELRIRRFVYGACALALSGEPGSACGTPTLDAAAL